MQPYEIWTGINWYVWELTALYIVFWICEKISILRKNYIFVLALSVIFVCIAFVYKIDNPWYGSTLCFWVGLIYHEKQEKFKRIVLHKVWLKTTLLSGLVGLSILLFFVLGEESILGNLIARNIASSAFVILIIALLYYASIGNMVSRWLGKYAYEVFLFHPIYIGILREYVKNDLLFSMAVIGCSCLSGYVYHRLADVIKGNLKKLLN